MKMPIPRFAWSRRMPMMPMRSTSTWRSIALEVPNLQVMRNDVYARFCHTAYNKGTALAEIARRLALGPQHTLAAGDHLNDLPMLSRNYAHFLVAPANAVEAVKTCPSAVRAVSSALCPTAMVWRKE